MAGRISATAEISDTLNLKTSFSTTSGEVEVKDQPTIPFAGTLRVPSWNPGNTFRAVNASGQPLFAVPDPANPTRPLLDAQGNAVLTDNPTDPASGVAFNETISLLRWRPYSLSNSPAATNLQENDAMRWDAGLEGEIGERWNWNVGYTYSRQDILFRNADAVRSQVIAALNCSLGPRQNLCFNPFGNSLSASPGSAQFNDPSLYNQLVYQRTDRLRSSLSGIDGVISGELGSGWAGPIGVALGAQYRKESLSQNFDDLVQKGFLSIPSPGNDFSGSNDTKALFVEGRVPLLDSDAGRCELSVAGRYEEDDFTDSFNPKLSLLYRRDWLTLRGSYGESFLSPSLFQRFGNSASGATVNDPVTGISGDLVLFSTVGSAAAQPQESTAYNLGATIQPIEGLSVSLDYWSFEFDDLLATLTPQAAVNANPLDPNIIRDPVSLRILQIRIPFFNAGSLNTDGVDVNARYSFPEASFGRFGVFAAGSWVKSYEVRVLPTSPVINGRGTDNSNNFGFAIPAWRANGGISWDRGAHSVSVTVRYLGGVTVATAPAQSAEEQIKVDLQYRYALEQGIPGLTVTLGLQNAFNELPNVLPAKGNILYVENLQDPLPRRGYVGMNYAF